MKYKSPILQTFFDHIEEKSITMRALAKELDISYDNLAKWKKGAMPSNPEDYKKIEGFVSNLMEYNPEVAEKNPFGSVKLAEERAIIRVLLDEVAIIKAKIYNVSYEEAKEELRRKTNLIVETMKGV